MTETERQKRGKRGVCVCWGVLADSPALHGSLTVSPVFILFVGGGEACCSAFTQNKHTRTHREDNLQYMQSDRYRTATVMTSFTDMFSICKGI